MEHKTNVMRVLQRAKVPCNQYTYDAEKAVSGAEVAAALGQNPKQVFKTLVTLGKSRKPYVFLVPVKEELDLKKAAKACGEKSVEMLKSKDLLPLTGYIHGGCSPIGMKKSFPTFIDESSRAFNTIIFSGGKRGFQVEISLDDLSKIIPFTLAPLCLEQE